MFTMFKRIGAVILVAFIVSYGNTAKAQQAMGTVIQATPAYESYSTGTTCNSVPKKSRGVLGAIGGGLVGLGIGSMIGQGAGREAAQVLGAAGGAVWGDNLQNGDNDDIPAQACTQQMAQRQSGTQVVVEYDGRKVNAFIRRPVFLGDKVRINHNITVGE